MKCILVVHLYLPLSAEKSCFSVKVNIYSIYILKNTSDEVLQFCAHKVSVSLEDDSALENYTSLHAVKRDEVGDNEETIADANLWLLRLGRHKQHEQMKRVCGMNEVQGGTSVLFLFISYLFSTAQRLR